MALHGYCSWKNDFNRAPSDDATWEVHLEMLHDNLSETVIRREGELGELMSLDRACTFALESSAVSPN